MEQEPRNPEQSEFHNPELEATEAAKAPERSPETASETKERLESARQTIEKQTQPEHSPAAREAEAKRPISGLQRKQIYADTMASLQRHLSPVSRRFSKVIHNPAIEKTSDAVGATVLRPSVTLGATATALLVGGGAYLIAKHYGYHLSGSIVLLSLIVGGLLGLVLEGLSKLFKRKS